jgi:hypothetical protein
MSTINDTINLLTRIGTKKEEWLKTQSYYISSRDLGEPTAPIRYPDGTLMELCTLKAVEEGVCWVSANVSFEDKEGKLKSGTIKIVIGDDEVTGTNLNPAIIYPGEVVSASGKLVHLMA